MRESAGTRRAVSRPTLKGLRYGNLPWQRPSWLLDTTGKFILRMDQELLYLHHCAQTSSYTYRMGEPMLRLRRVFWPVQRR